ncbi:MAG: hypothetical protein H7Z72_17405, partial [Bacteroidetes bacterium]|nr:hypothetical protein [Fibrella sp.]
MRRIDITNSVLKVKNAISDSKIDIVIKNIARQNDSMPAEDIIESMEKYSYYYRNFSDNDKKLIEILGLQGMESPKLWATILTSQYAKERRMDETIIQYYGPLNFIDKYLDQILHLFKQDNVTYTQRSNQTVVDSASPNQGETLTVVLPEKDSDVSSSPERLIKALNSINSLYKVLSEIMGHQGDDISVLAIDSGSDKSFDFLGAAKVMTALKELIIDLWDSVVFFGGKKRHGR